MPQLKIKDLQDMLEKAVVDINNRVDKLEASQNAPVAHDTSAEPSIGYPPDTKNIILILNNKIAQMSADLNALRNNLVGHVEVYNNHIVQQHNKR